MIDIHTHIIPHVDDGSHATAQSLEIIKNSISMGITKIVCTPHYRSGKFEESKENIVKKFQKLLSAVEKEKLNVELILGQEIYCSNENDVFKLLENSRVFRMGNTNFILLEFSYQEYLDISEVVYIAKSKGYRVIIAHIERYDYMRNIDEIRELKGSGAFIQVNASAIIGKDGHKYKKIARRLLKEGLVDFIASDVHHNRINYMSQAYRFVSRKYGIDYANNLFMDCANKYLFEKIEKVA